MTITSADWFYDMVDSSDIVSSNEDNFLEKQEDIITTKFFVNNRDKSLKRILSKEEFDKYDIGKSVIFDGDTYTVYGEGYEVYKHRITEEITEVPKMFEADLSSFYTKIRF